VPALPSPDQVNAVIQLGVAGVLAFAVIAFVLEIVVSGRAYRRALAERDAAYERLARILDVVEATTGVKAKP
jgi:hypothetical protein